MKFNESWLREHVPVEAARDALCAALTAIGLEVEGVEPIGGELPGVIVAEIETLFRNWPRMLVGCIARMWSMKARMLSASLAASKLALPTTA